jgi:hypothetical protein
MKFFIDTEFLEGPQKKSSLLKDSNFLLASIIIVLIVYSYILELQTTLQLVLGLILAGIFYGIHFFKVYKELKKPGLKTIDLISIGIVREDGEELYMVSKEFNLKEAWDRYQMKKVYGDARNTFPDGIKEYWIRNNVLKAIFEDFLKFHIEYLVTQERLIGYSPRLNDKFTYKNLKYLLNLYGYTTEDICKKVIELTDEAVPNMIVGPGSEETCNKMFYKYNTKAVQEFRDENPGYVETIRDPKIEFYAWYADYDWVVFCWLFGRMLDLPSNYPMYCNDLKQSLVEKWKFRSDYKIPKHHPEYPTQDNEHNALDDAKWNKALCEFIEKV